MRGPKAVEWLTSVAVVGVLAMWGLPAYHNSVSNKQLNTARNELITVLNTARSEAVLKRTNVTVCPKKSLHDRECAQQEDWSEGWLVFYDKEGSRKMNGESDLILNTEPLYGDLSINYLSTHGAPEKQNPSKGDLLAAVTFNHRGFASKSAGSFSICDDRKDEYARGVVLASTGSIYLARDSDRDEDFIPEDSAGNNLRCL